MARRRHTQLMKSVLAALEAKYGREELGEPTPALEELVFSVFLQSAKEDTARKGVDALMASYVDLNEVRVASASDLADALKEHGGPVSNVRIVVNTLNALFSLRHSLALDWLREVPRGKARKFLAGFDGLTPQTVARVMLFSLDHSAFPVDDRLERVALRLGLVDADATVDEARKAFEAAIPDKDMYCAYRLLSAHADEVCLPRQPRCSKCEIARLCPSRGMRRRKATEAKKKGAAKKKATAKAKATAKKKAVAKKSKVKK